MHRMCTCRINCATYLIRSGGQDFVLNPIPLEWQQWLAGVISFYRHKKKLREVPNKWSNHRLTNYNYKPHRMTTACLSLVKGQMLNDSPQKVNAEWLKSSFLWTRQILMHRHATIWLMRILTHNPNCMFDTRICYICT